MKKLTTKLMISVLSVALAFIALGTSTFAWFSMNTTVEATGMQLTAVTPINLLISDKETNPAEFSNSVAANETSLFSTYKLYPASSADGKTFNAIMNSGNYIGEGEGGIAENDTKFQATATVTAAKLANDKHDADGYWAEYTFQLKLSEEQTSAAKVYVSKLDFYVVATVAEHTVEDATGYFTLADGVYTQAVASVSWDHDSDAETPNKNYLPAGTYYLNGGIANAVRAALFVGDVNGGAIDFGSATMKALYANVDNDSANAVTATIAEDNTPYDADGDGGNAPLATTPTTAKKAFKPTTDGDKTAYCFDVNDDAVNVVLRVWIEGQDTNCVNAYAGQTFKIDLAFQVLEN